MPRTYRNIFHLPLDPNEGMTEPEPIDADDSIVLSDLLRTGEASRLRRRGAMRIDHTHRNSQQSVLRPSLTPTVIVVEATDREEREDTGAANPRTVRDRSQRYRRSQQRDSRRFVDADADQAHFTLFCGGSQSAPSDSGIPYEPSPLPLYPPLSSDAKKRSSKRFNGCGALLHIHASPRPNFGVWTANCEGTSAVVAMDAMYFDRMAVARLVQSSCGCIREGIGCAVCGNPLGTRYRPCKSAENGIFTARPKSVESLHPEGLRYWHAHSHASSGTASQDFHVYTFFSTSVSPSPSYTFPSHKPTTSFHEPTATESRVDDVQSGDSTPYGEAILDRGLTSSPTQLSDVGEEDGEIYRVEMLSSDMNAYPQPNSNATLADFDPDGEFITDEPGSPDKSNEFMLLPDR